MTTPKRTRNISGPHGTTVRPFYFDCRIYPPDAQGQPCQKCLQNHAIGVVLAGIVVFLGLGFAIKATLGLRAKESDDVEGLDITLHGETGYNFSAID